MPADYIIGIDLGTTNCVLAYAPLSDDNADVQLLPIPQVIASGTVEARESLPSFLYLATAAEAKDGALDLDWTEHRDYAVGEIARVRSAEAPDRTVGAAKSWLCNTKVNRREAILPWNAPAEINKVSPVTASQYYLQHLVDAWENAFPDALVANQKVVITVPASFDPVARELTREAALAAGVPPDFVLLEEPQAAVYAWLSAMGDEWRKSLAVNESVLVCDVGGGTTDLTLIEVGEESGELILRRAAVGEHLLVGGDNMDLAVAHQVAAEFTKKNVTLNPWQSVSLWHSCRAAKETLLADAGPATHKISVLGRGSKLIGGTVSVEVERSAIASMLMEGFLPSCAIGDRPERQPMSGFQEIGLPYESDPAITRHLAAFVSSHCRVESTTQLPTHVLFNGGVFKADGFRQRLLDVIGSWSDDDDVPQPLDGVHDLDHAVARGACYYGWNKERGGMRIRGGVARSYYVGIETAGLAIPGAPRPLKALCVVPFGMEEGTETEVPSHEIGLVLGRPARFRFFSSTTRQDDQPGTSLDSWNEEELSETDPLETTLTSDEGDPDSYMPVKFQSKITELGLFELWCVGTKTSDEWKLEFNVREE